MTCLPIRKLTFDVMYKIGFIRIVLWITYIEKADYLRYTLYLKIKAVFVALSIDM